MYIFREDDGHWPRFLSKVFVNWLSAGGTFRRWFSTRRCLCILTYLGHFTNLCRSLFGGRAPPIPNCFGRFSNKGFATFVAFSGTCSSNWADQTTNTHTHTHQLTMLLSTTTNASPPFAAPIFQQQQRQWHTFFFSTGVGTAVLRVPFLGACNTENRNTSFLAVSEASIHCRRRKK